MLTDNKKKEELRKKTKAIIQRAVMFGVVIERQFGSKFEWEDYQKDEKITKFTEDILSLCESIRAEVLKEVEKEIMSYQVNGYDFDGDRFYDLLKFLAKLSQEEE